MKLFLSVLLFAGSLFSQTLPADMIQGHWHARTPIYAQNAQLFMSFDFSKTQMKLTGTCVYQDQSELSASVQVHVAYAGSDLYIQESKQTQIDDGYKFCKVYLTHSKWQFYFNGVGAAVLIAPVPYGMQFQLVR